MDLASKDCVPCRGGVPPLSGDQLRELREQLDEGWEVVHEHHLEREFGFEDFAEALAYVNRVGAMAEEQGHHPDIHRRPSRPSVQTPVLRDVEGCS